MQYIVLGMDLGPVGAPGRCARCNALTHDRHIWFNLAGYSRLCGPCLVGEQRLMGQIRIKVGGYRA